MHQDKQLIPFGEISESFTGLKDKGIYYVDKTGFIPYLISQKRQICVFTRPRRFGKTLMLRTLQTFFEYALDDDGNPIDNRRYFEGLKVMDAGEDVLKHLGQYPVISVSLKSMRNDTLDEMVTKLRNALSSACSKHDYLLDHPALSSFEREQFLQIRSKRVSQGDLEDALGNVCKWIYNATKRHTVILIDEYDVPLQQAAIYDNRHPGSDLFEKTVKLVGNFISSGFKSNDYLEFGIISGCMRVAKESIFTGMNNPGVITVMDEIPDEYWGFTTEEVQNMLAYYGLEDQMDTLKYWYDGYDYSNREVYNPWSVLNAIRGLVNGHKRAIQAYWVRTSSNDIIDDMIERNPEDRHALARIMEGNPLWAPVFQDLSYRDLNLHPESIWSFLLYTGYLKAIEQRQLASGNWEARVTVPNKEVKSVMYQAMEHWWRDIKLRSYDSQVLLRALLTGDTDAAGRELRFVLNESTSVFDYNEAFYHGMLVGLLKNVATVRSNDEYGEGRPDIVAVAQDKGIVLEVKCVTPKALAQAKKTHSDMDEEDIIDAQVDIQLNEAEKQIKGRKYVRAVLRDEPGAREVVAYAVCFCKKWCVVRAVSQD